MLAWIQRIWVVGLVIVAAAVAALAFRIGLPWWAALLAAVLIANIHAVVLAIEFTWLRRVRPGVGIPRPAARAMVAAWWGEVVTGLRVFGWRQPFRAGAVPDELPPTSLRRGVLLIHGFICNRGLWNPWMQQLRGSGTPYLAINLEPVLGSIDNYVQGIEAAVARLESTTRCAPIVVAHSMGGLAVRAWLRDHAAEHRVHSVVTIGTPHAGTTMARFALSANTRQMREGNPWLRALQASETRARRQLFTCYFGHCDNIVFPACNGMLADATNRHVPGVAHVHLAFHAPILDDVLSRAAR
jgi:pimeloyl-ACP methyl ester carboxylesterase